MSRGRRSAMGQPSRRDERGRSLPSDRSMQFVAVDLVCGNHPAGEEPLLARFAIDSWHPAFDSAEVYERGDNRAVEGQVLSEPDGTSRIRYKVGCPKCRRTRVFRSETIDEALRKIYEPGAHEKIVPVPV